MKTFILENPISRRVRRLRFRRNPPVASTAVARKNYESIFGKSKRLSGGRRKKAAAKKIKSIRRMIMKLKKRSRLSYSKKITHSRKRKSARTVIRLRRGAGKSLRRRYGIRTRRFSIIKNPVSMFSDAFSRDTLLMGAGSVMGTFVTGTIVRNFGNRLPGANNPYVVAGYQLAIPVLGAALVGKFSKSLAKGMVIGGLAGFMGSLMLVLQGKVGSTVTPTGEYLGGMTQPGLATTGEYLGAMPSIRTGYQNVPMTTGEYLGSTVGGAFDTNPWN